MEYVGIDRRLSSQTACLQRKKIKTLLNWTPVLARVICLLLPLCRGRMTPSKCICRVWFKVNDPIDKPLLPSEVGFG